MNFSYTDHVGNGSTISFPFSFVGPSPGYLSVSNIKVYVNDVERPYTLTGTNQVTVTPAPASGSKVRIRRVMNKDEPFATFNRGNAFSPDILNKSFLTSLYIYHEFLDGFSESEPYQFKGGVSAVSLAVTSGINMNGSRISNLGLPVASTDAATKGYIDDQVSRLDLQYPPIPYAVGLTLDSFTKTYIYNDDLYIWGGELGTVTTGGFDETGWLPIKGDMQLRSDVTKGTSLIRDVKHLRGIFELGVVVPQYDGQQFSVAGFYAGSNVGGGTMIWDSTRNKADHNGGTVIAPEAVAAWNGTHAGLSALLNWTGGGTGCYLLKTETTVIPENFGAIGYDTVSEADSGVDSSLSIQKVVDSKLTLKLLKIYAVKNIQAKDGTCIVGDAFPYIARSYDGVKNDAPMLVAHSSAVTTDWVLNVRGVNNVSIGFINIDGRNRCSTVTGGSIRMSTLMVGIRGAKEYGLGDLVSYTKGLNALGLTIRESGIDNIVSLIDSHLVNPFISAAVRHNINLRSGSNSVVFTGGKIEWAGQHNITAFQCNNLSFSALILDRAGHNGIRLNQCRQVTGDLVIARSGAQASGASADLDSHIRVSASTGVVLKVVTKAFGDDGGAGYTSPRYTLSTSANSKTCQITGDLSGNTVSAFAENAPSIDASLAVGYKPKPVGLLKKIEASSSQTFIIQGFDLNTFDQYMKDLSIYTIDDNTGQDNAASFKLLIARASASATVVSLDRYYASSGHRIDSIGTPVFTVSATVSVDGSEITVTITSSSTNINTCRVSII